MTFLNDTVFGISAEISYVGKAVAQYFAESTMEGVTVRRSVRHRLSLLEHPYVHELQRRLIEGGLRGLQDADTASVLGVRLVSNAQASDGLGGNVTLAGGAVLDVQEGSALDIGGVLTRFAGGALLGGAPEAILKPSANTAATLRAGAAVRRAAGDVVQLTANAAVQLVEGTPRPALRERVLGPSRRVPGSSVTGAIPQAELDFHVSSPSGPYNWEIFFHAPFLVATHLSRTGRFAQAQEWFHLLFDPRDDQDGPSPERYWKVAPFRTTTIRSLEEILTNIATGQDPDLRTSTILSIDAWQRSPFRPHLVARYRTQAYMYATVMAYLDNLIAWGDSLFRQDTGEAIDEAVQAYVLAANILGPRPMAAPAKGKVRPQSYATLRADLKEFGTVLRDLEPDVVFDLAPPTGTAGDASQDAQLAVLRSIGRSLYFAVPPNPQLLGYWDTVADRLFKIRNSLDINGVFRRLALFDPPIDPGMLARATAAGLDVAAVVSGLNQPLPLVRFRALVRRAAELTAQVSALGQGMLQAMEKEDGEALALLRQRQEREILENVERVKYGQVAEAVKAREALQRTLTGALERYRHYELLLGASEADIEKAFPVLDDVDRAGLERFAFGQKEPELVRREDAPSPPAAGADGSNPAINAREKEEMDKSEAARTILDVKKGVHLTAQGLALIPDFTIDLHYWGLGGNSEVAGGSKASQVTRFIGDIADAVADRLSWEAGRAALTGGLQRREEEWVLQANNAANDINQIVVQLRAAQLREAVADLELATHRRQKEHADEVERFLNANGTEVSGKRAGKALYAWLRRETASLHRAAYQHALEVAKKAESALRHELGDASLGFIGSDHFSGREGLLAGERLALDIARMETAYAELDRREYELQSTVSLLQLAPEELLKLRATGSCTLRIPESFFDLDAPGHYFRRIRSLAITVPCVTGPYASVNLTLTLTRSTIRTSPAIGDGYERTSGEDPRLQDYFGSARSVVASSADSDSGLFDGGAGDERYLPFENAGAISEWTLRLPVDPSQGQPTTFDYNSIADVLLHVRYTAREGGDGLRAAATSSVMSTFEGGGGPGGARLIPVRHEFPAEWAEYRREVTGAGGRRPLRFTLRPEHFPYWARGVLNGGGGIARIDVVGRRADGAGGAARVYESEDGAQATPLTSTPTLGGLVTGTLTGTPTPERGADGAVRVPIEVFPGEIFDDVWLIVTWTSAP